MSTMESKTPDAVETGEIGRSRRSSISEDKRPSEESRTPTEEVLLAAGVGLRVDDPTLPCLTLRMWVIGIGFCLVGSGVNTLYTFRFPSVTLSQSAIQFLAYPVGKAWELVVPDWGVTLLGVRHSLNPGPFNYKENILIYILANLSYLTRLSADVLTEQRVFYGADTDWGFEITITLATILFGFSLAGFGRSLVVEPKSLVWPGVLANTALNAALHPAGKEDETEAKWRSSRYKFFLVAFSAAFVWYWFPDFIFPALSYFTWVCWTAPRNPVVNQLFGMKSGIGLLPFTFDWSQISYIGSPLVVPTWAILNTLASVVFWIYIVTPAIYYTNTWLSAYLPIQSNSIFDNRGLAYNVSRVINKKGGFVFEPEKYEEYSHIYLPVTYALNSFGLCFACISSLFVWMFLEKRHEIAQVFRESQFSTLFGRNKDARPSLQPQHSNVPIWWYAVALLVSMGLGIFACEFYPVQLRWYGVIFAMFVSAVFYLPLSWVYATTNMRVQIDIFCRIIAGYVWEGKVLANIWFFDLGYISGIKALAFAQDLKLGIYCNIPPRHLFVVQVVGLIMGTMGQVAVLNWALSHVPDICSLTAKNGFTCPYSRTHFNTSMVWGALGPRRFFADGTLYRGLLWFFLVGAILPIIVYAMKKAWPKQRWLEKIHVPLFLGGLNYIPPASGTNYGSWVIVGLVFGLWIKRNSRGWWRRYNFVLSSALDCATAIAGIIIFFAIFYTGASDKFSWWGTTVYQLQICHQPRSSLSSSSRPAAARAKLSILLLHNGEQNHSLAPPLRRPLRLARCPSSDPRILHHSQPAQRYPPGAPKLTRQQPRHPLQVQRPEREAHRRDPQAVPRPVQKGRRHAPAGPRPAPARLHQHQRHERGRPPARDAPHASLRGRLLLHHVQPHPRRQILCPGLHNDPLPARRLRLRRHRQGHQEPPRHQAGRDHKGRPLHLHRGRVPRRLRQRPHDPDQRRLLRGPHPGDRRQAARGPQGHRHQRHQQQEGPRRGSPFLQRVVREQRRPDEPDSRAVGSGEDEVGFVKLLFI